MSSNTKIVVLRSKELVYALVFLILSVLIIMAALSLFTPKNDKTNDETYDDNNISMDTAIKETSAIYTPGIYSSIVSLGNTSMELKVAVDYDHINSIAMSNIDETIETLYPLVSPTLSELSASILAEQSTENITYPDENRYTSLLLLQAIDDALSKARISEY